MKLTNQIHPSQDQIMKLASDYPKDQEVVMVNIVRLKNKTSGGQESGAAAYERYGKNVLPFLKKVGGRVIWRGLVNQTIIGSDEGQPHLILLVKYPSTQKFLEMVSNPEYQKCAGDRTMALEYGGLLATTEVMADFQ